MEKSAPFWRRGLVRGEFRDVGMVHYAVGAGLLAPYVPNGVELDAFEGHPYVSLVAQRLVRPRVLGLALPTHNAFIQVSLRFYVRQGAHRGVVFLREHVGGRALVWGGKSLFREPYERADLSCAAAEDSENRHLSYRLASGGQTHRLSIRAACAHALPEAGSLAAFLTQRPFAYVRTARGKTLCYALSYPIWRVSPAASYQLSWDFGALYGPSLGTLSTATPAAVFAAEGSRFVASLPWLERAA
jgi:uncharacterized protein YqjF (DUF2071 family)